MTHAGRHVLVLGLGESGLAMVHHLRRQGARVRVADSRPEPPGRDALRALPGVELRCGPFDPALLDGIGLIAISPGLDPRQPLVREAAVRGIPLTGEIELFAEALAAEARPAPVIAITGTNGKTTTTALTGHLGRACGIDTAVAGNISPAALDEWMRRGDAATPAELWVLELSSFQLETVRALHPVAATVLNISDDHLDRYDGLEAYAAAKTSIFSGHGVQVLNRQDARVMAMQRPSRVTLTFGLDQAPGEADFGTLVRDGVRWLAQGTEALMPRSALPLVGEHNVANALAALALGHAAGLPMDRMLDGLRSFRGLPHRVEPVAQRADGVVFYDDSKGTNVGATLAALEGLGRRVVLIAGGDGKGQDFGPLRAAAQAHARAVVLIGRDAAQIAAVLDGAGVPVHHDRTLEDAVLRADALARPGDAVLLSPACASLDMFRNYAHRAEVFCAAVLALPGVSRT